jgi:hypothetical protein
MKQIKTRWLSRVLLVLFLGIAAFFLWTEHRAHLLGALPWILLFVSCALLWVGLRDLRKDVAVNDEAHRRAS